MSEINVRFYINRCRKEAQVIFFGYILIYISGKLKHVPIICLISSPRSFGLSLGNQCFLGLFRKNRQMNFVLLFSLWVSLGYSVNYTPIHNSNKFERVLISRTCSSSRKPIFLGLAPERRLPFLYYCCNLEFFRFPFFQLHSFSLHSYSFSFFFSLIHSLGTFERVQINSRICSYVFREIARKPAQTNFVLLLLLF